MRFYNKKNLIKRQSYLKVPFSLLANLMFVAWHQEMSPLPFLHHMFKQEIYKYMEITNQKNRVKQGS